MYGISRSGYYKSLHVIEKEVKNYDLVIDQVHQIREEHPKIGGRKLLVKLAPFLKENDIKIGRDAFFNLLRNNDLLVKSERKIKTTYSLHKYKKYPNIIKNVECNRPEQIWVADITYWLIEDKFVYITLITDAYSHKIVGYHISKSMKASDIINALEMALRSIKNKNEVNIIHHSDRGIQFCSIIYTKKLLDHGIRISMTEKSDPRENAIAERINGIIKIEYLNNYRVKTFKDGKALLERSVNLYNDKRIHQSINYLTPSYVHDNYTLVEVKKLWKKYYLLNKNHQLGSELKLDT